MPGFASAVAGKQSDFKAWYDGLSWYWKAPLSAARVAGDLYTIWEFFH
ncbi:hypothetical protein [Streptomyces sp. NPDC002209]